MGGLRDHYLLQTLSEEELIEFTQEIKVPVGTVSITIGINLWFAPQISEHCP